jgi:hypothetical protein
MDRISDSDSEDAGSIPAGATNRKLLTAWDFSFEYFEA